jgi:crossover junction endodeoxyribonuclease RuvC
MAEAYQAHRCILGIDPSLRGTGYGIIQCHPAHPQVLASGVVECPSGWPRSRCLVAIAQALRDAIRSYQPTVCAIEGLFYAQNHKTTLIMGEARGACLFTAAEAGLPICEIAPRKVKQAVVGYGAAQKPVVAKMVQRILHLESIPPADAADALAIALAFLQENRGLTARSMKWI